VRNRVSTAIEIIGLALVTAGCALLTPIAGLIFGGLALVAIGYALDRSPE
jgi:hypothetical protein